ncbi:LysR family transcriptional regulator, partial [Singulisphaera rosea]
PDARKRPELLVRTYVASMSPSDEFGPMVAAEARRRNFDNASGRVFIGDGSAWIWTLKKECFPTYQAVVDFLHVLGHVFAAAKAAVGGVSERWTLFQAWAEAIWKGQTARVLSELRDLRDGQGAISDQELKELAEDDPRKVLAQELGYLERNESRMGYPRYRQEGLPWTSSHIESTVKLFNRRVKGSEKFWGESGAETILQLRAAVLSEDNRLQHHLKTRPASPFRSYKAREKAKAA